MPALLRRVVVFLLGVVLLSGGLGAQRGGVDELRLDPRLVRLLDPAPQGVIGRLAVRAPGGSGRQESFL